MANTHEDLHYCRVSGDRQEKEETIDTQIRLCAERSHNDSRAVGEVFKDEPFTGTLAHRPALDRLFRTLQAGRGDRVVMSKPDRMARGKPWLRPYLEERIRRLGAEVVYVKYQVDDSPEGRAQDGMQTVFSEWEREAIQQRTADGRATKLARGAVWRSRTTLGWRYVKPAPGQKDGHLEVEEAERPLVAEMFRRILRGETSYGLAALLNSRGVPSVTGGNWSPTAVQQVIHNPIHAGRVACNRYERVQPARPSDPYNAERKTSQRQRPREEWQYIELPDRIVSPEEWEQAQTCLKSNQRLARRNAKRRYLLSGLLFCDQEREALPGERCGRRLVGTVNGGKRCYRCSRKRDRDSTLSHSCPGLVAADDIEGFVWAWIESCLTEPTNLMRQLVADNAITLAQQQRIAKELESAQAHHAACQTRLTALLRKNLAGEVDDLAYGQVQRELVQAREATAAEIAYLQRELASAGHHQITLAGFTAYCEAARADLARLRTADDDIAFAIKQKYIRAFLTAIRLPPNGPPTFEGILPQFRPDQMATLAAPPDGAIAPTTSSCRWHNRSDTREPMPLRFSIVVAA